ncbi:MAG: mechanosensitive ion channel family protein [bacterium]
MRKIKTGSVIVPFGVFLITLVIIMFNIFDLNHIDPANSLSTKNIVIYVINILFWLTTAYIVNKLTLIFFWANLLKQPGKNSFFKLLYRIFSMTIYTLSLAEILFGVLPFVVPEVYWYIILILFLLGGILFHNKITEFFGTNQLNFEGSYNLGDWVELIDSKSGIKVSGKVLDFTRKEIILQSCDNGVIFVPNELKGELIVKNYDSLNDKNEFELALTFSALIPIERVKRILYAAVKEFFVNTEIKNIRPSNVFIKSLNKKGIEYVVKYYFKIYKDMDPADANDQILNNIVKHFGAVGIELNNGTFIYKKSKDRDAVPTNLEELIEGLKNINLFDSLNDEELLIMAKDITTLTINPDDTLIKQGDEGNTMYILIEGILSVNVASEMKTIKVGLIKPGSFFGEMSLLTGEKRNATIIAESESIVYEINKQSIEKIILARQEILQNIAEVVTERQRANLMKLEELKMHKDNLSTFVLGKIKDFLHIK